MRVSFFRAKNVSGSGLVSKQGEKTGGMRFVAALLVCVGLMLPVAKAQTGGEGGIQGTVTDSSGAVVPNAVVTATAESTNVATSRTSSSAGLFTITPLIPDTYTVTVTAKGFHVLKQQHIVVTGLSLTGFNATL